MIALVMLKPLISEDENTIPLILLFQEYWHKSFFLPLYRFFYTYITFCQGSN